MKDLRLAALSVSLLLGWTGIASLHAGSVKTGLDVLVESNFEVLAGKRVGLLTAETAISRDRKRAIDAFAEAPNLKLVSILAPEHGLSATRS